MSLLVSGPTDAAGGREPAARHFLEGFRRRHGSGAVRDALATFRPLKVLVVDEAIIDEYDYCVPLGKAPKDPMISARHVKLERQAGGVLACANHMAGFCDEVDLVTSLGADDSQEAFIRDRLRRTSGHAFSSVTELRPPPSGAMSRSPASSRCSK